MGHTKEAKSKMKRKAERHQKRVVTLKESENQATKRREAETVLVKNGVKKAAEQEKIIQDSKEELQAAQDSLNAATSRERRKMARDKVKELAKKFDGKKKARQLVTDDNVEIKISYEKSRKAEVLAKDAVAEMAKRADVYEKATANIQALNLRKIQKRKEQKEAEVLAKKHYAEKRLEARKAKHKEEYQKYM